MQHENSSLSQNQIRSYGFSVYYLEPNTSIRIFSKDIKDNYCAYKVSHDTRELYSGAIHHEIKVDECEEYESNNEKTAESKYNQIFVGGVEVNQDGSIDTFYPGICLVKGQEKGFIPHYKSAKELQSLEPYAVLVSKDLNEDKIDQDSENAFAGMQMEE